MPAITPVTHAMTQDSEEKRRASGKLKCKPHTSDQILTEGWNSDSCLGMLFIIAFVIILLQTEPHRAPESRRGALPFAGLLVFAFMKK